jgi:hypothetical protein
MFSYALQVTRAPEGGNPWLSSLSLGERTPNRVVVYIIASRMKANEKNSQKAWNQSKESRGVGGSKIVDDSRGLLWDCRRFYFKIADDG